jgi:hypothetical protein
LRAAYATTDYQVWDGERWLAARLGQAAPGIERLLHRLQARRGTFVTAWNPRSEPASEAENAAAAAAMAAEIAAHGWRALPHRGVGDDPAWPPEEGWFVLDPDDVAILTLAEAYGQNAVVRIERGRPADLIETHWLTSRDRPSIV